MIKKYKGIKILDKQRKSYKTKHARMAPCNQKDFQLIFSAIHFELKNPEQKQALAFIEKFGIKKLCILFNSMRRWFTGWSSANVHKLESLYPEIQTVMDTSLPSNIYRGFTIFRNVKKQDFKRDTLDLTNVKEGDVLNLEVIRNAGATSFTKDFKIAERFAKPDYEKFGIVVQLMSAKNPKVLIAPKFKTKKWFNELYEITMNKSHRIIEQEWLIFSPLIKVKVIKVKK